MIVRFIDYFRDRLPKVIRLSIYMLAMLVIFDALFISKEHVHTFAEHIPGFWSLFGFAACVLIIIVSKWYGHLGIMTREDYYDK